MSNFDFLQREWFAIHDTCVKAESYVNSDARAACFYARIALEQMVGWLYKYDKNYTCYDENLGARIYEPCFRNTAGDAIFTKATVIVTIGNRAAHGKSTKTADALAVNAELFHVAYWLARTYGERARPDPALQFNPTLIPVSRSQTAIPIAQLERVELDLRMQQAENQTLRTELEKLKEQYAQVRSINEQIRDTHNYNEAQTRDYFIDLLLNEAGFALDHADDKEYKVEGMPNNQNVGFVDYVLWGADRQPLAVVEAKRTKRNPLEGQQQAKLYADCLEAKFGRRPVIYLTNGYEHYFWDDTAAPMRKVSGFHKRDELELLMQRRTARLSLTTENINADIAGRAYQQQAIRSVAEAIEQQNQRRSLLVMATGSGKTRTVIALVDLMMRCNYVKRVLFLADRVSLVNQAAREFGKNLASVGVVNLRDNSDATGRVYVSTYPTMLNLINNNTDVVRKFGIGYFDLVIVDEAHRSIYSKYGALFNYFDSYLVGLTATPKNEVDHNTYQLFQLERGVPTFNYSLDEAIRERHLVPYKAISVPLKFQREGIKYDDLSEEEKQQWDEKDWGEEGAPDQVAAGALNKWLFNEDTVDKVLEHVMTQGEMVASGDRLGKTIIFAKNNDHAEFIEKRFNINYPQYNGKFARVITYKVNYAQSLIDSFSNKDDEPHIAISVDMMDTGIDVPEVLNLVFFKQVHSKTKFWQMIGRGTRLCENLYAPSRDKKFFNIFDFCQNFEYFSQNPNVVDSPKTDSLDTRLFKKRLSLLDEIDNTVRPKPAEPAQVEEAELRTYTADLLHDIVSNMTLDNISVRPQRLYVEKYSVKDIWKRISTTETAEAADKLAALPSQRTDAEEEAKHFDYLILSAQISVLQTMAVEEKTKLAVQKIMSALEEQPSIPAIRLQLPLIQALVGEEWWADVSVGMLEHVRKQLRMLVKLIEKRKRSIIYTNFEDEIGEPTTMPMPTAVSGIDYERFKQKSEEYLMQHKDHIVIAKLRKNLPITASDLAELERIMLEQAGGNATLVEQLKSESEGLGLFVRSLIGLELDAANAAMSRFLSDASATKNQIAFVRMVVQQLTHDGAMKKIRLYQSPFTDLAAAGPESLFAASKVIELIAAVEDVRRRAVA